MGEGNRSSAQFSIYKVCFEEVEREFTFEETDSKEEYASKIVEALVNSVAKIVKKRPYSQMHWVEYKGFCGILFKTVHDPSWEGVAREIISGNQYEKEQPEMPKDFLKNTNISYVLFYIHEGSVYALTGGYGSNYISKFIEKNFGLYLIPKIVEKNNPVVKTIIQNNLLGNQTATQKTNKQSTSISIEQDMSSIFRQLNIEIDRGVAEDLGIEFNKEESESKKIGIMNKDSLVIRRSISLSELQTLIHNIYDLERTPDNFALNYLVLASKKRIKNSELYDKLIEILIAKEFDRFILSGDDYTSFYTGADRYVLYNEEDTILLDKTYPLSFQDIVDQVPDQKFTKSALQKMLKKWHISTFDNAGNFVLYRLSVYDAIQGVIEFGSDNCPCYLFNGQWYVFDDKFSRVLKSEFEEFFVQQLSVADDIAKKFDLRSIASTEDKYNSELQDNPNIAVSHTVLRDYVEIADAIFWDESTIYLMHNKHKFNGVGVRDVTNQVLTSAEYLQQNLARRGRESFLDSYYDAIADKYSIAQKSFTIKKDEFIKMLTSGRSFKYVIGYIDGFKKGSQATYAKYLTIETVKKLAAKGIGCIVLDIHK